MFAFIGVMKWVRFLYARRNSCIVAYEEKRQGRFCFVFVSAVVAYAVVVTLADTEITVHMV